MKILRESLEQKFIRNSDDKLSSLGVGNINMPIDIDNLSEVMLSKLLNTEVTNLDLYSDYVLFELNIKTIHSEMDENIYTFVLYKYGELQVSVKDSKFSNAIYEFKIITLKDLKKAIYDKWCWES